MKLDFAKALFLVTRRFSLSKNTVDDYTMRLNDIQSDQIKPISERPKRRKVNIAGLPQVYARWPPLFFFFLVDTTLLHN